MKMSPETAYSCLAAAFASVEGEVEAQAQELFGDSEYGDGTDEEFEIIFSGSLSHAEKVAALKELRRKTLVGVVN